VDVEVNVDKYDCGGIAMLRNGREGIKKLIEKQNKERNLQAEKAHSADEPKKVLKVRPISQAKAEYVATAEEKLEDAVLHRQENIEPTGLSVDLPKNDHLPRRKGPRFEDTHVRFTNYLQKELYTKVQDLRKRGEIDSVTALLDASVRDYLKRHYIDCN
jgi:hypothetical protein